MSKVKVNQKSEATVNLNAEKVWEKLIDFGGTEKFVPDLIEKVVVQGNGIGAVRTIYLKGGGEILEKLTSIDQIRLKLKFIILSTPMPIFDYEGVFTVNSQGNNKCTVIFESNYEVQAVQEEEMHSIIKDFQKTFLSNLEK